MAFWKDIPLREERRLFLIFSSGKLVCVGATKEKDAYRTVEKPVAFLERNDLLVGVLR